MRVPLTSPLLLSRTRAPLQHRRRARLTGVAQRSTWAAAISSIAAASASTKAMVSASRVARASRTAPAWLPALSWLSPRNRHHLLHASAAGAVPSLVAARQDAALTMQRRGTASTPAVTTEPTDVAAAVAALSSEVKLRHRRGTHRKRARVAAVPADADADFGDVDVNGNSMATAVEVPVMSPREAHKTRAARIIEPTATPAPPLHTDAGAEEATPVGTAAPLAADGDDAEVDAADAAAETTPRKRRGSKPKRGVRGRRASAEPAMGAEEEEAVDTQRAAAAGDAERVAEGADDAHSDAATPVKSAATVASAGAEEAPTADDAAVAGDLGELADDAAAAVERRSSSATPRKRRNKRGRPTSGHRGGSSTTTATAAAAADAEEDAGGESTNAEVKEAAAHAEPRESLIMSTAVAPPGDAAVVEAPASPRRSATTATMTSAKSAQASTPAADAADVGDGERAMPAAPADSTTPTSPSPPPPSSTPHRMRNSRSVRKKGRRSRVQPDVDEAAVAAEAEATLDDGGVTAAAAAALPYPTPAAADGAVEVDDDAGTATLQPVCDDAPTCASATEVADFDDEDDAAPSAQRRSIGKRRASAAPRTRSGKRLSAARPSAGAAAGDGEASDEADAAGAAASAQDGTTTNAAATADADDADATPAPVTAKPAKAAAPSPASTTTARASSEDNIDDAVKAILAETLRKAQEMDAHRRARAAIALEHRTRTAAMLEDGDDDVTPSAAEVLAALKMNASASAAGADAARAEPAPARSTAVAKSPAAAAATPRESLPPPPATAEAAVSALKPSPPPPPSSVKRRGSKRNKRLMKKRVAALASAVVAAAAAALGPAAVLLKDPAAAAAAAAVAGSQGASLKGLFASAAVQEALASTAKSSKAAAEGLGGDEAAPRASATRSAVAPPAATSLAAKKALAAQIVRRRWQLQQQQQQGTTAGAATREAEPETRAKVTDAPACADTTTADAAAAAVPAIRTSTTAGGAAEGAEAALSTAAAPTTATMTRTPRRKRGKRVASPPAVEVHDAASATPTAPTPATPATVAAAATAVDAAANEEAEEAADAAAAADATTTATASPAAPAAKGRIRKKLVKTKKKAAAAQATTAAAGEAARGAAEADEGGDAAEMSATPSVAVAPIDPALEPDVAAAMTAAMAIVAKPEVVEDEYAFDGDQADDVAAGVLADPATPRTLAALAAARAQQHITASAGTAGGTGAAAAAGGGGAGAAGAGAGGKGANSKDTLFFPDYRERVIHIFEQLAQIYSALGERFKAQSYLRTVDRFKKGDKVFQLLPPNLLPLPEDDPKKKAMLEALYSGDPAARKKRSDEVEQNRSKRNVVLSADNLIPGLGFRLREKLIEILVTGELEELRRQESKPIIRAIRELTQVHGVGPRTAVDYFKKHNISTVAQLRDYSTKAGELDMSNKDSGKPANLKVDPDKSKFHLNDAQRLGLVYYEDMNHRIPHEEGRLHEAFLKLRLRKYLGKDYDLVVCGSYRRQVASAGDIDVLITRKRSAEEAEVEGNSGAAAAGSGAAAANGKGGSIGSGGRGSGALLPPSEVLGTFLSGLKADKYIEATLAQGPTKFMGLCRLRPVEAGSEGAAGKGRAGKAAAALPQYRARRLDVRYVDSSSYPAAMLYFTGSKNFNVIMRSEAIKKRCILNEYGLFRKPTRKQMLQYNVVQQHPELSFHDMITSLSRLDVSTVSKELMAEAESMAKAAMAAAASSAKTATEPPKTVTAASKKLKKTGKIRTKEELAELREMARIVEKHRVKALTERALFDALGMDYVAPKDRNV